MNEFNGNNMIKSYEAGANDALKLLVDNFNEADDSYEVAKFLLDQIPKIDATVDISSLEDKLGY